jgi:hypothetical protein
MSVALIGFVGMIYLAIAVSELSAGNNGLALVFFSYALANVGLIMVSA